MAILSRYPIISVKTHQFERFKSGNRWTSIFSRDCLEVKIAVTDKAGKSLRADYKGKILTYPISERIISPSKIGKTITIFANHFKSKLGQPDTNPEKSKSWKKRKLQSERTAEILHERFGKKLSGNFVVAGDLNNSPDSGALKPLLDTGVWNIVEKSSEPWTHYYDKTDHAEQFDYLLLSKDLKKKNSSRKPIIERRGLAINRKYKIKLINSGPRFKTVDKPNTESSDHAAIFVNLTI